MASGDRDSFRLASSRTRILYPSRGGELARIGPEEVRQRYGVAPNQVPDFIALRGDRFCQPAGRRRIVHIVTNQLSGLPGTVQEPAHARKSQRRGGVKGFVPMDEDAIGGGLT